MTNQEFWFWAENDLAVLRKRVSEEGAKLREEWNEKYLEMAGELMMAGWTFEYANGMEGDAMSWYWRRPAIGKKGKLFKSTDQAWKEFKKKN